MKRFALVVALIISNVAMAEEVEKFSEMISIPSVDQFTASGLVDEGHCVAGVSFVITKGYGKRLAKKVSKRLSQLGANAWVLIDYETTWNVIQGRRVTAVQIVPMQCVIEIKPKDFKS